MAYGFFMRSVKTDQTRFCHAQVQISEIFVCVIVMFAGGVLRTPTKMTCLSIKDSDEPEHQPCLITVLAMHLTLKAPSAEMFKKPLWQTVWTQIRLLL